MSNDITENYRSDDLQIARHQLISLIDRNATQKKQKPFRLRTSFTFRAGTAEVDLWPRWATLTLYMSRWADLVMLRIIPLYLP